MALIRDVWPQSRAGGLTEMQNRLQGVQASLCCWEQNVFCSVRKTLASLRHELEQVKGQSLGVGPSWRQRQLMSRISEMLSREEIMERQGSRLDWLEDGDCNTAMFQAKSRARAKRNKILALKRDDGSVATKQEDLEVIATDFYKEPFSAQDNLSPELVLDHVPRKVTDEMNTRLTRPYTSSEVEKVLQLMKPNKDPGPDGFTAGFYQLHWDLLGPDIISVVLDFLNGGEFCLIRSTTPPLC